MLAIRASCEHCRELLMILLLQLAPVVHAVWWPSCFVILLSLPLGASGWALCLYSGSGYSVLWSKHQNCHIQAVKSGFLGPLAFSCVTWPMVAQGFSFPSSSPQLEALFAPLGSVCDCVLFCYPGSVESFCVLLGVDVPLWVYKMVIFSKPSAFSELMYHYGSTRYSSCWFSFQCISQCCSGVLAGVHAD